MGKKKAVIGVASLLVIGSCIGVVSEEEEQASENVEEESVVDNESPYDLDKKLAELEEESSEDVEEEPEEGADEAEEVVEDVSPQEEVASLVSSSMSESQEVEGVEVNGDNEQGFDIHVSSFYESSATLNMTANKMERDMANTLLALDKSGHPINGVTFLQFMNNGDEKSQAMGASFKADVFDRLEGSEDMVYVQDRLEGLADGYFVNATIRSNR